MQSKLPPHFEDSFERRSFFSRHFGSDIAKKVYEHDFYNKLIASCGCNYTYDQLVQYQYAQMRRWKHYCYDGFHEFIHTFPFYEDYILELSAELQRDPWLKEQVKKTEQKDYDTIKHEASRIRKKREYEKEQTAQKLREYYRQQRQSISQEIFKEQATDLECFFPEWEHDHPGDGIFKDIIINIHGHEVWVRGRTMDGIPKIGTMFIKSL